MSMLFGLGIAKERLAVTRQVKTSKNEILILLSTAHSQCKGSSLAIQCVVIGPFELYAPQWPL